MRKDIEPEMIAQTREILIDRNSEHFPDTQGEKALHDYKVLIDENIPPSVAGFLRMHFRKVSHTDDAGLTGKKDDKVWDWAVNNGYNIIITKDRANISERDLTFIATQDARSILRSMDERRDYNFMLSDLPLIVHLPGGCDPNIELKVLLRSEKGKSKLFNFVSNRATPYIDIIDGKIICGPTYFELRGKNYIDDNKIPESIQARKIETRELFKALWLGRLSPGEIRNMNPEREKKIDDQIEDHMQRLALRKPSAARERRLTLLAENPSLIRQMPHASLN
ncbi:MAG: hypothetical protein DI586_06930 [Micavibrio aeruginosavorus]|uniref:DUF5615 domain-containing protein n=1 Tax=Micavibrio aeruginosavorus TaxID=349221 RepID=A0A2W5FHM4_9BACT|nr:MAG: hypothetical protein DI586_06930 [Micavibrio aeruginosavorus]